MGEEVRREEMRRGDGRRAGKKIRSKGCYKSTIHTHTHTYTYTHPPTHTHYLVRLKAIFLVVSSCQHLLAEGDDVSGVVQSPVLVGPEFPRRPTPCLHLIH
jgi:hypothetical protein